ncbi:rod shape-determining protein RodA [Patescibacteria group bacterium]|nr:rod shape-determining protein RodA [Patescibacteria group bacterium]
MNIPKIVQHFKKLDWFLILVVFLLSIYGLIIQYSLDLSTNMSLFWRQVIYFAISFLFMFIFSFYNVSFLDKKKIRTVYYIFCIILLALIVFGSITRGAKSWLDFGIVKFQPSEIVKIISIFLISDFWFRNFSDKLKFKKVFSSFLLLFPSIFLILIQPDFGSAFIVFAIWALYILILDRNILHYLFFLFFGVLISLFLWNFVFTVEQQTRINSFINPLSDPMVSGYQVRQSMIAIGSGGIFGKGFNSGLQSQLKFLPEPSNDFVFAALSEEFGLIGSSLLLILFIILFYRIFLIIKKSKNSFNALIASGVLFLFFIQVFINIGMNLGIMPVTGISLPFISSGGSNLLASFICIGILLSLDFNNKK